MADVHGAVELGLEGVATVVDGTVHVGPKCTYIAPGTNAQCLLPAYYEFELNPRNWPGVKPPIIQYACQLHGKDVRSMVGVVRIDTL